MSSSLTKIYWDTKLPIYKLSHSKLSKLGITSLLIDVDGTLLSRESNIIPYKVKNWIIKSKEIFDIYLISNNPSERRIYKVGEELGLKYKHRALKPRIKNTLEIVNSFNKDKNNIAIIGDRIFTDIIVGNRCKIKTILIQRLDKKGFPLKFNTTLFFEKIISLFLL
tara:strand:- start:113 stop:610 length:498 start_codon:yes stop_codon:yes gene_type:complete